MMASGHFVHIFNREENQRLSCCPMERRKPTHKIANLCFTTKHSVPRVFVLTPGEKTRRMVNRSLADVWNLGELEDVTVND